MGAPRVRIVRGVVAAIALAVMWSLPSDDQVASAAPTVTVTEYAAGISGAPGQVPGTIAAGPDGNVWFTEYNQSIVAKITPTGQVTEYQLPAGHHPYGITAGPDGALWVSIDASTYDPQTCQFTGGHDKIARVTTDGQVTMFDTVSPHGKPSGITVGPDGALWFGMSGYLCLSPTVIGGSGIGRITTAGVASEFTAGFDPQEGVGSVANGPDGRIWFTDLFDEQIGAMTAGGTVTHHALPYAQFPSGLTTGPDGNVWFTINRSQGALGRSTPGGDLTFFTTGLPKDFDAWDIAVGPDQQLWFVGGGSGLGQITTAGTITMVSGISAQQYPAAITPGPAGSNTLWFAGTTVVGKVQLPAPPPTSSTTTTTPAGTPTTLLPVTPAFTG